MIAFNESKQVIRDAIITPISIDRENKTIKGCVYDQEGFIVDIAKRKSGKVQWKTDYPNKIDVSRTKESLRGSYLYLGHLTGHYGHFLLESLSRCWALMENTNYDGILFHPFIHKKVDINRFGPLLDIIKCFDQDINQVQYVERDIVVEELTVPEQIIQVNKDYHSSATKFFHKIRQGILNIYKDSLDNSIFESKKNYLSRSKFRINKRVINELELESMLKAKGFNIIYPEQLKFYEQLILSYNSDFMIGLSGSAMHNSLFMSKESSCITIGDSRTRDEPHINQVICDKISGVKSVFVPFKGIESFAILDVDYVSSYLNYKL